jgi:signal transduction histidine kinase
MTDPLGLAGALVSLTAAVSGLLLIHTRTAQMCGWLLLGAGGTALLGLWLLGAGSDVTAGRLLLVVAGLVLFPASLWAYPAPRWRHTTDVLLAAGLVGPGLVGCFYTQDGGVLITMGIVAFLSLVAQMWWRLETSEGPARSALVWVSLTTAVAVLLSLTLQFVTTNDAVFAMSVGILAAIPMSMAVGCLRPDSVDVRGLVVGASVAVALTVGYLAYFMTAVALLDVIGVPQAPPAALAAIGLLGSLAVHPAGSVLRGVMDQLLFGTRPDPLDAATRVIDTIGTDPDEALATIRSALALPYVGLRRGDDLLAVSGEPVMHVRRMTVESTEPATVLEVGLRPGDLRLPPSDSRVLRLVSPLMAQLVRATDLSLALQQSRAKAITGIADERRRLRNELHDDLGPTLTGIAMSTDAARNLVATDPVAADELLHTVRRDISAAIAQVRNIVYGMRPPALDELGLVDALGQWSRSLDRELDVTFHVRGELATLPASVEVAAYRIVTESLTNVARHCGSGSAVVTLDRRRDVLHVLITDSGPPTTAWTAGVGLASMRERVTELGGTLSAGPGPAGGEVRAALPLSV